MNQEAMYVMYSDRGAMTPLQVVVLVACTGVLVYFVYMLVRILRARSNLQGQKPTFGFSGKAGDDIPFTCPVGTEIAVYRATYICADMNPDGTVPPQSDPDYPPWDINHTSGVGHAVDATTDVGAAVNGKQTATFIIPSGMDTKVAAAGYTCSDVRVSGSYNCIAVQS